MTLREVGQLVGGMDYTAVSMAIKKFKQRTARNMRWRDPVRPPHLSCRDRDGHGLLARMQGDLLSLTLEMPR